MTTQVLIAHANDEENYAEQLAGPIRDAGYEVIHYGTLMVGESLTEEASKVLMAGAPVVLCGTINAVGTPWARRFVNAARQNSPGIKVFGVRMQKGADVEQLTLGGKITEYWQDSAKAVRELISSLQKHYPLPADTERDRTKYDFSSGIQSNFHGEQRKVPLIRPRDAEHFVDREAEQDRLLADLKLGRTVTICGPGGIGKTALVAEVIRKLAPDDTPPAAFPDGILYLPFYGQAKAAVALEQIAREYGEESLPTPALAAQRALSKRRALLVLDGTEETDNLRQVLDVCGGNAVLVISQRRTDAADPAYRHDLQPLPMDKAVIVMHAWGGRRASEEGVTTQICEIVGRLPLALRLAGKYLSVHEEEANEYLRWLQEAPLRALDQGSSKHESIRVLLERSIAKLSIEAKQALTLIGFLALAPFDCELVQKALSLPNFTVRRALGELVNYGLVVRQDKAYEVSHRLIHTYACEVLLVELETTDQQHLAERVIQALTELFPGVSYENWVICEGLVPHIQACAAFIDQHEPIFVEKEIQLLYRAGWYLIERARYEQAEPLIKLAQTLAEKELGSEDALTAVVILSLGTLYQYQRKYERAEPLYRSALAINEKALGPEHPNTAAALNGLAGLYEIKRKYEQAEPLYRRALAIYLKKYGPEHPNTAAALNNLAGLYIAQRKYRQAQPLYQQALVITFNIYGPEHPDSATTLNNLATLYQDQRQYERTEILYKLSLAIYLKAHGPEHPATAAALRNLAGFYSAQGKYERADHLKQLSWTTDLKALGPEYPSTKAALVNYALLQKEYANFNILEAWKKVLIDEAVSQSDVGVGTASLKVSRPKEQHLQNLRLKKAKIKMTKLSRKENRKRK